MNTEHEFGTWLASTSTVDLSGTNAISSIVSPIYMKVMLLRFIPTVLASGATAAVVTVTRQRKNGSATSDLEICTISIPAAAIDVVGDYADAFIGDLADTTLSPGENLTYTSDGGSDAGTVHVYALGIPLNKGPDASSSYTAQAKLNGGIGSASYLAVTDGSHA